MSLVVVLWWGLQSQFPPFRCFLFFQYYHNTSYLLDITFIFERGHRSSATVASVKYKCDSNNLRGSFGRSKILLTEKLTNGALVTPTPELWCRKCAKWFWNKYVLFFLKQFMTTTRLIWKLRKFAIRGALQTKCVGGGGPNLSISNVKHEINDDGVHGSISTIYARKWRWISIGDIYFLFTGAPFTNMD